MFKLLLCYVIVCCMWCIALPGYLSAAEVSAASQPAVVSAPISASRPRLTLDQVVRQSIRRNSSVISDYLQTKIAGETVKAERSIYQPVFQASFLSQTSSVQNSTDDILVRSSTNYEEFSNQYDAGFSGIIPTGAQWDLKFVHTQKNSSSIDRYRSYEYEYSGNLKFSLTQPLLKGVGADATNSRIDVAVIQEKIDVGKFEQRSLELIGTAVQVYWRLYGAQKIYETWYDSLKIAEQAVADSELRYTSGRLSVTEFLEAKNSLLLRKAELYAARSRLIEAVTQLHTLMNIQYVTSDSVVLYELDEPAVSSTVIKNMTHYRDAIFLKWPEYQNSRRVVEKERKQLAFASNQSLPQLDLVGSISTNSLGGDNDQAFRNLATDNFISWSVGLKFNMPLFGGAARNAQAIAHLRLRQAETELAGLERSLNNSIVTRLDSAQSMQSQLHELEEALQVRRNLLDIERERLNTGKVSQKALLSQEEEYVNFQRRYLSSIVSFKTAVATLELSSGELLAQYGVDAAAYQPDDSVGISMSGTK